MKPKQNSSSEYPYPSARSMECHKEILSCVRDTIRIPSIHLPGVLPLPKYVANPKYRTVHAILYQFKFNAKTMSCRFRIHPCFKRNGSIADATVAKSAAAIAKSIRNVHPRFVIVASSEPWRAIIRSVSCKSYDVMVLSF
jgi:hypothetical protein